MGVESTTILMGPGRVDDVTSAIHLASGTFAETLQASAQVFD